MGQSEELSLSLVPRTLVILILERQRRGDPWGWPTELQSSDGPEDDTQARP